VRAWGAFREGLARALRYKWMLLILLAVNLLSALPLAALPAVGLADGLGRRPAIREAADDIDAWFVIEALMVSPTDRALGAGSLPELTRWLRRAPLLGLLTAAALPLLAWLPAAFLSGGLLLTYAEAPQHLRWRRFLWGCWHWWGAFLLLGAVQGFVAAVGFFLVVAALAAAAASVGGWSLWVLIPPLTLCAVLWLALFEYTRIIAVVEDTRNVVRAFGRAALFTLERPLAVAGLYGLALLLLGAVHALYHWGLSPYLPLDWWLPVLIVQQAFILARLWARLVRLAGSVALYQGGRRLQAGE
jgi:hypothetical protein